MYRSLLLLVCAAAVLLCFAAAFPVPHTAAAGAEEEGMADAATSGSFVALDDWQYKWGDQDGMTPLWKRIEFPLNPPGRNGSDILWLRTALPGGNWDDPVLKVRIYQLFEIYSEDQMVYRFGRIDRQSPSTYLGTPPRLIRLPPSAMGKPLYFRIYSDGSDIGILGSAAIANRSDMILGLMREQLGRFILGCLYVLMGFLSIYPYIRLRLLPFLSFGCFAVLFGLYTITHTTLIYLFRDSPLLWTYTELATLIGGFASIIVFFCQMFGEGYRSVLGYLWRFHLLYGAAFLSLVLAGSIRTSDGLFLYQIILLFSMIMVLVHLLAQVRMGNRDARILLAGSVFFFVMASVDIVGGMMFPEELLPPVSYFGMLVFLLALLAVLIRRSIEIAARLSNSEKLSVAGQLAAGVVHEIRNPVTVLSGYLQLMKKGVVSKGIVDIMLSEVNRINLIMDEFLFLARPSEPKFGLHPIRDIIHDVMMLFEAQAESIGVEIRLDCPDKLPMLLCDSSQLKQVFVNLLKNSLEAMNEGGHIDIEVSVDDRESFMTIRFTDEGCGISAENMAKIGEPFYTTKENGNGLGIMVTRSIIEQHKGRLRIESEPGVGTAVEIMLPLKS